MHRYKGAIKFNFELLKIFESSFGLNLLTNLKVLKFYLWVHKWYRNKYSACIHVNRHFYINLTSATIIATL